MKMPSDSWTRYQEWRKSVHGLNDIDDVEAFAEDLWEEAFAAGLEENTAMSETERLIEIFLDQMAAYFDNEIAIDSDCLAAVDGKEITMGTLLQRIRLHEKEENREQKAVRLIKESGKTIHSSDCSTSIAPAEEPGPCDCKEHTSYPCWCGHAHSNSDLR